MKKVIMSLILTGLLTGMGFARGTADDGAYYGGYGGASGPYEHGYGRTDAESFTGTFNLKDGQYPMLETTDGERYYLTIDFPIDSSIIPENGDELVLKAFRSSQTPNTLHVVPDAEVYGRSPFPEWEGTRYYGGHHHRYGPGNAFPERFNDGFSRRR